MSKHNNIRYRMTMSTFARVIGKAVDCDNLSVKRTSHGGKRAWAPHMPVTPGVQSGTHSAFYIAVSSGIINNNRRIIRVGCTRVPLDATLSAN